MLKRALKIAAAVLALILVVVVGGLVFLDVRYGLVRPAPHVSHAGLADEHTAIRLVVDASRATDEIHSYVNRYRPVPKWVLPYFTPYELALLIGADVEEEKVFVAFHVMERRLGPVILDYANRLRVHDDFTFIEWAPPDMRESRAGVLTVTGTLDMEKEVGDQAWLLWNQSRTLPSLQLEGGHFAELVMDNRQAGAYAAMASFLPHYRIETEELEKDDVVEMISELKAARLVADFQRSNQIRLHMTLEFREEEIEDISLSMKLLVDLIVDAVKEALKQRIDVDFEGGTKWENNILVGEFLLSDVDKILDAILTQPAQPQRRR